MAEISEHNQDCKAILGRAYENVHLILDQYAKVFDIAIFGDYHRTFLHNQFGVELARHKFGKNGARAAMIHIVRDWHGMPLGRQTWEWVERNLGKTFMHFNNMDFFDPHLDPRIISAWKGKGLCCIAFNGD